MAPTVAVHRPTAYDDDVVAAALGEATLPLAVPDRVPAPFITIDGRIHTPSSNFLRQHCMSAPNLATATRMAADIRSWLDYLCNDCGLYPHEDIRDPLLAATEDHFAAYYRRRQYGTEEDALTSAGWARASSTIKRLYEYCEYRYQHVPPFQIVSFTHRSGYSGTKIAGYGPRQRDTGSAGTPVTPEFAEHLLMGALRVDKNGTQYDYRGADRDHAVISLGLATGIRRNNLVHMTTYEVPRDSALPITTIAVADVITKNEAGGDALVFSHRLGPVHDYMSGRRAEIVQATTHTPDAPLPILHANSKTVTYLPSPESDEPTTRTWDTVNANLRRRLVNPDGSSPILFLNEYTGGPLAYSTYQHIVNDAADFAREHVNPNFPDGFRIHDLRHTYAVHMTVAMYRGVIANAVGPERQDDWVVDRIADAVELVKYSLGHASKSTTELYISTAHRFLHIPIEQFTGEF